MSELDYEVHLPTGIELDDIIEQEDIKTEAEQ